MESKKETSQHYEDNNEEDIRNLYGLNLEEFQNKKVLVIGAGGIGCELLKCLVMSGLRNITTVDLDKIEKSNLNRQFLFNKDCVGKYKSEMARESILKTRGELDTNIDSNNIKSDLDITSLVGNIKDKEKFDLQFFKSFDVILNALDNIDARTYINQICIRNNIPLVNSGTEGYLGNVATHIRDLTPCYNCAPKNKQKAIPICSIRSKPEKIEHCVAWAKSLFELLFCDNQNGNHLEGYKINQEDKINFQNYFFNDVINYAKMTPNSKVNPLDIHKIILFDLDNNLDSDSNLKFYEDFNKNIHKYDMNNEISKDVLNLILIIFNSSKNLKSDQSKFEKFDKENKEIVNFVFACSNLRAINFNLMTENRFKIKEIAGNIIPAIASTNAIIAAIQTMETIKVLNKMFSQLKNVNYTRDKKIASIKSTDDYKSDECPVCSKSALLKNENRITITVNVNEFKMNDFVNFIKERFYVEDPMISLNKNILYESGEDLNEEEIEENEKVLLKNLNDLAIKNMTDVKVSDMNGKINFVVFVINEESFTENKIEVQGELNFAEIEGIPILEENVNDFNQIDNQIENKKDEDIIMQDYFINQNFEEGENKSFNLDSENDIISSPMEIQKINSSDIFVNSKFIQTKRKSVRDHSISPTKKRRVEDIEENVINFIDLD